MKRIETKHLLGLENISKNDIEEIIDVGFTFREVLDRPIKKVPVSILSLITEQLILFKDFTPSISNVLLLDHFILAPATTRKLTKSLTSGSIAIFLSMVLPLDNTEAIITCSDAPTENVGNINTQGFELAVQFDPGVQNNWGYNNPYKFTYTYSIYL